jgi:HemY protein
MRTVIGFTILAALCVWGAWWVAALPGSVSITVSGTTIETSTPIGLTLLALLFLAIYVVIRLIAAILRSPRVIGRWRKDTNRRKGDLAVNRTLVALAANDTGAARREADRSRRLLGDTPLTLLLAAQAGRQAGREDDAQAIFTQLAARPDGKLLGIRGLMRQAVARQDWAAAAKLAEQAEAAHPGAAWLTEERRRMALQTGQYREALRLMGPSRRGGADPDVRAALAIAAAEEEPETNASLRLAKQAFEADPSLGPAAIAYATRLRKGGRERSGLDILRRCWSLLPQPGVADAYMDGITDPISRHSAAGGLVASNPRHPDSALLLAHTAMEAGLTAEARRHLETARNAGLSDRRLYVLQADLAELDGDAAASQEALRAIPAASPGPTWRCLHCGTIHAEWHALCDACATPGRIKWTASGVVTPPAPKLAVPQAIEGLG